MFVLKYYLEKMHVFPELLERTLFMGQELPEAHTETLSQTSHQHVYLY